MRRVTWNVNSIRIRLDHVLDLIENRGPDVVRLQVVALPRPSDHAPVIADFD